jgi:predicted nucleotidyltransferase
MPKSFINVAMDDRDMEGGLSMCKVTAYSIDGRIIYMADIKQKYVANIIDAARKCDYIDKIILFGSALEERCQESSDMDLAIFGNQPEGKCLTSAKYRKFARQLSSFDEFRQNYDLLYFKTGKKYTGMIMKHIMEGETLYEKQG